VYEVEVREKIERLKLEANVTLTTEFLPEDVVQGALMAADVIVLPYHPTEESASAALRFVLPLGKPLVATDLPIFADAETPCCWSSRATQRDWQQPSARYCGTHRFNESFPTAPQPRHADSDGRSLPLSIGRSTHQFELKGTNVPVSIRSPRHRGRVDGR